MRAPAIPPAEIGADLQPLYDDMRQGTEHSFKGFVAIRPDGALGITNPGFCPRDVSG